MLVSIINARFLYSKNHFKKGWTFMKKLSFVLVLLALASILMGQALLNENFENVANGALPEGWEGTLNTYSGVKENHGTDGSKGLTLNVYGTTTSANLNTTTTTVGPIVEGMVLKFDYRIVNYSSYPNNPTQIGAGDELLIKINGTTALTIDHTNHTVTTDFANIVINLDSFAGQSVNVMFDAYRADGDFYVDIDNVKLYQTLAHDLAAQSISGPSLPTQGVESIYTVRVFNEGTETASSFTVKLMQTPDTELVSINGTNLQTLTSQDFELAWTPDFSGAAQIYGLVVYASDEYNNNNQTDTISIDIQPAGTAIAYIGNPASTTTATNPPLNYFYKNSVSQTIYLESEISAGGLIEAISYRFTGHGDIPEETPVSIYMATTDINVFETTTSWIGFEEFTLVFEGSLNVTDEGTYDLYITLDEPFPYDGGNLVIMGHRHMDSAYYSLNNKYQVTAFTGNNRTLTLNSDSIEYNPEALPAGTTSVNVPNTSLFINTAGLGSITGLVNHNGNPLVGVDVLVQGTTRRAVSNASGEYTINFVSEGTVTLVASRFGYENETIENVVVIAEGQTTQNISMTQLPTVNVTGIVLASDTQQALANAEITLTGYEDYTGITTNANGQFTISGVYSNRSYTITVTSENYQTYIDDLIEVGLVDLDLGNITLEELTNPPANVVAQATDTQVSLTWSAPGSSAGLTEFTENFEGDFSSWEQVIQGAGTPGEGGIPYWYIGEPDGAAYDGNCAKVDWGYNLNTWLITPLISITNNTIVSFDFNMSYHWAVSPNDNQDLMIKVSTDGNNWTQIWREEDYGTFENFTWLTASVSLADYAGQAVHVAFNIVGDDNANTHIDNVFIGNARSNGNQVVSVPNYSFISEKSAFVLSRASVKDTNKDKFNLEYTKFEKAELEKITATPSQVRENRALESYNIYRANVANLDNENLWDALAQSITDTTYTDLLWETVETGEYKYIVKAVYTNNVMSAPAYSNSVSKNMSAVVNITINTSNNASANGALITLTNSNENPAHVYQQVATGNVVNFPDVWLGTYTITAQLAGYSTAVYENVNINSSPFAHTVTLTVSSLVVDDDFESYPDFALEFGQWTLIDLDMSPTFGITNVSFPNSQSPMAYIVFNPSQTTPASTATPYSGQKMAASFGAENGPNNDWMISPLFEATAGSSISFWGKSITSQYGLERFKIAVGTSPNPANMTVITPGAYVQAPVDWTEFTYSLADFAGQNIHVAIVCVSDDAFIFFVDDVKIEGLSNTDENTMITPQTTQLNSNYPNPFNPSTIISFDNAKDSNVKIDIFNVKGQKVKTLVNDHFKAGSHNVEWNGTDDNGKNVSSGIYFYNMKSGKYTATRKMILMK